MDEKKPPESPANRLEMLMDLFAPVVESRCETCGHVTSRRDPSAGLITREQFMELLEAPVGAK